MYKFKIKPSIKNFLNNNLDIGSFLLEKSLSHFKLEKFKEDKFVIVSDKGKFVVQSGVDPKPLQIIAQNGITPDIIVSGILETGEFIFVQNYVEASIPEENWLIKNPKLLVSLIQKLHNINNLKDILPKLGSESHKDCFQIYLQDIEKDLDELEKFKNNKKIISSLFYLYSKKIQSISSKGLCPIHGDLYFNNLLLAKNSSLYLIDWEELHMSDPVRDIALLAWSCFPRKYWKYLSELFGYNLDNKEFRIRFFLHISTRFLYLYLELVKSGYYEYAQQFIKYSILSSKLLEN
ncbi:phosphotransferase [Candidatus Beckwithbacteria bacterium]|nr:phosphotransferase [Candidatus Beckwithbacteria bacterium]